MTSYMEQHYGHLTPSTVTVLRLTPNRHGGPKHSKTPPLAVRDIVNRPTVTRSRRTGLWLLRIPGDRQPIVFVSWRAAMDHATDTARLRDLGITA